MTGSRTFVGFGFGAIQAGLFALEASRSGRFSRIAIAEVRPDVVNAIRDSRGTYCVNVAFAHGVEAQVASGIEMFNLSLAEDRRELIEAIRDATDIATAVPAVEFYFRDEASDIVSVLGAGLRAKVDAGGPRAIIYTAENNNRAAEILAELLDKNIGASWRSVAGCLNTVIGKMSGIITDPQQVSECGLATLTKNLPCVYLVEAFNRILVERPPWDDFEPGITAFVEKSNLLPFEEAKLFGHNAIHSLLGFLLQRRNCKLISEAADHPDILALARRAFIDESGRALVRKHNGCDELFTDAGFEAYAEDLLQRMLNPFLRDAVSRVTRDPRRKLGWDDRFAGAIRLAMQQEIHPDALATGMAAAVEAVAEAEKLSPIEVLQDLWPGLEERDEKEAVKNLIRIRLSELQSGRSLIH